MAAAALLAARTVDYVNAGSVEFLVDERGDFYFLEMNTRLQVEHPVTEMTTGVDLVRTQIEIAAGAPLPFQQSDLNQRGHAIECRVYAEDVAHGFLPSIGQVTWVQEPVGPGIRVDSSLCSGERITHHYDPLLAKLVVSARDRDAALERLRGALQQYAILGDITTNLAFLQDIVSHPNFAAGSTTTSFIPEHFADWAPSSPPDLVWIAAAILELMQPATPGNAVGQDMSDPYSPWLNRNGFRIGEE